MAHGASATVAAPSRPGAWRSPPGRPPSPPDMKRPVVPPPTGHQPGRLPPCTPRRRPYRTSRPDAVTYVIAQPMRSPTVCTITFDQIHQRVAEHQAAEASRNAPRAVAVRAVYTLASALADLCADDRRAVLALLAEEEA